MVRSLPAFSGPGGRLLEAAIVARHDAAGRRAVSYARELNAVQQSDVASECELGSQLLRLLLGLADFLRPHLPRPVQLRAQL